MDWEAEELHKLRKIQPDIVDAALKELWQRNPVLHKSIVINAYLDEKINLGKAAELLGIDRMKLQKELRAKGIPVRFPSKEDVIAEVEAIKAW